LSDYHKPALVAEFLELLAPGPGQVIVDGTVGGGGHAEAVLTMMEGRGKLIGIDRDQEAINASGQRLAKFGGAVTLVKAKFSELDSALQQAGADKVDRAYFDLGVSSRQLDDPERGFSFMKDGPLDMRMDQSRGETAADLLKKSKQQELERIFWEYGEERFGRRVAKEIVRKREKGVDLGRTRVLAEMLEAVIGRRGQRVHPATRIFQALRIAVNLELEELVKGLQICLEKLSPGGRMLVISYHSLEDRLVKNFYRDNDRLGLLKVLTKKPVRPGEEEVRQNPRSRSARLRAAEKI
jgi:16S rRNA (cytosine1402-N4)-methyltransferase